MKIRQLQFVFPFICHGLKFRYTLLQSLFVLSFELLNHVFEIFRFTTQCAEMIRSFSQLTIEILSQKSGLLRFSLKSQIPTF